MMFSNREFKKINWLASASQIIQNNRIAQKPLIL